MKDMENCKIENWLRIEVKIITKLHSERETELVNANNTPDIALDTLTLRFDRPELRF